MLRGLGAQEADEARRLHGSLLGVAPVGLRAPVVEELRVVQHVRMGRQGIGARTQLVALEDSIPMRQVPALPIALSELRAHGGSHVGAHSGGVRQAGRPGHAEAEQSHEPREEGTELGLALQGRVRKRLTWSPRRGGGGGRGVEGMREA